MERVTRLVCIFAAQKLMFGSVKPSPPTVHRTVGFHSSSHRHLRNKKKSRCFRICFSFYGAGDEARTRYLHLGKVALYRMSYTRGTRGIIAYLQKKSTPFSNFMPYLLHLYCSGKKSHTYPFISSGFIAANLPALLHASKSMWYSLLS